MLLALIHTNCRLALKSYLYLMYCTVPMYMYVIS